MCVHLLNALYYPIVPMETFVLRSAAFRYFVCLSTPTNFFTRFLEVVCSGLPSFHRFHRLSSQILV